MSNVQRRVALAIGIAEARPLKHLAGAVNGARAFHEWAQALGYESHLVTDEAAPVTLARLRAELEAVLAPNAPAPIQRLLLYFAGHGLIHEAEQGFWLLSDWHDDLRAVAVEVLKRRLYRYRVEQISIFADACRSLPADIEAADLVADGVLGKGPGQRSSPAIDKFVATQDGAKTYMVPGPSPDQDRCIFTGVLLQGLWGLEDAAFSIVRPNQVTSQSLGSYLKAQVPAIAKRYRATVDPSVNPTFPELHDVYYVKGTPPLKPTFHPWPEPAPEPTGLGGDDLERIGREGPRPQAKDELRAAFAAKLQKQPRPDHFETGAGFAIEGVLVKAVWTAPRVIAEAHEGQMTCRVQSRNAFILTDAASVLIEFTDGLAAAVTALPGFVGALQRDPRGVSALVYRKIGFPTGPSEMAAEVLARMEAGALQSDEVTTLAVSLREQKHADPVLGVISAYLYDSIGDIESIRRTAYYYTAHSQPIPYDIALLAQLPARRSGSHLEVDIPKVPARKPRTPAEEQFDWAHSATQAASGLVAGFWPWLRQGWAFLEDPSAEEATFIAPGLGDLTPHLQRSRFTTFDAMGCVELAALFGLVRRPAARTTPPPPSAAAAG